MIESLKNQKIKDFDKLRDGKHRRKQNLFILEGDREIERALANGYELQQVFACQDFLSPLSEELSSNLPDLLWVSPQVFKKLAIRESTGGMIASAKPKFWEPESILRGHSSLILALESLEKPGNLGAILRTADAVGASGIVMLDEKADIYNPHAIRASLGAVFALPIVKMTPDLLFKFCQEHEIQLLSASPFAEKQYFHIDYRPATALVFGSEAFGLSSFWQEKGEQVKIPMNGICDSLNVSVSAALLAYEALRQRTLSN